MHTKGVRASPETMTDLPAIPAGDFSSWLRHARQALLTDDGTDVDCRDCTGCCTSSYFIHIRPDEKRALERIPKNLVVAAPGQPRGHKLMGYDHEGRCPMLVNGQCSIYEHRPQTCRNYDCRVFTAAGILAGEEDKARINQRVEQWQFSYPTSRDREEHLAVQAAARFIREHAHCFPGGRVPTNPSQLAILALKSYEVFLEETTGSIGDGRHRADTEIANAIVEACRKFDAGRPA